MSKDTAMHEAILTHLRGAGGALSSRALAARFLKIDHSDEETCRRLLAPFLSSLPGLLPRPGQGWVLAPRASATRAPAAVPEVAPAPAASSLRDFVALASEGAGPGGSGAVRAVSILPVLEGEECQEEHFPTSAFDGEGPGDGTAPLESGGEGAPLRPEGPAGLRREDLAALAEAIGDLPVVCHRMGREVEPIGRAALLLGVPFRPPVISASRLGHLLLGLKANHAVLDLALALGLEARGVDDHRGRVRMVAAAYLKMIAILEQRGIRSLAALLEYQEMPAAPLDLSPYAFVAEDLKALPSGPGVYLFRDRGGGVIYVGKSRNLRVRVGSYFVPSARGTAKGRAVLEQAYRFEVQTVASELEAALLEAALIAEHRPPLNRQFEVHERAAPYGPRLNLVVVVRDALPAKGARDSCTLHLLRGGRYLGREAGQPHDAGPDRPPGGDSWRRLAGTIAAAYFAEAGQGRARLSRPRRLGSVPRGSDHGGGLREEGVDIDWQLVASYVRAHRDEVNALDVDECASPQEALARLRVLIQAACSGGGRVVAR